MRDAHISGDDKERVVREGTRHACNRRYGMEIFKKDNNWQDLNILPGMEVNMILKWRRLPMVIE